MSYISRIRWMRCLIAGLAISLIPIVLTFGIALTYAALFDPNQAQFDRVLGLAGRLNGLVLASVLALLLGVWVARDSRAWLANGLTAGLIASIITVLVVLGLGGSLYWPIVLGLLLKPVFAALGAYWSVRPSRDAAASHADIPGG